MNVLHVYVNEFDGCFRAEHLEANPSLTFELTIPRTQYLGDYIEHTNPRHGVTNQIPCQRLTPLAWHPESMKTQALISIHLARRPAS